MTPTDREIDLLADALERAHDIARRHREACLEKVAFLTQLRQRLDDRAGDDIPAARGSKLEKARADVDGQLSEATDALELARAAERTALTRRIRARRASRLRILVDTIRTASAVRDLVAADNRALAALACADGEAPLLDAVGKADFLAGGEPPELSRLLEAEIAELRIMGPLACLAAP